MRAEREYDKDKKEDGEQDVLADDEPARVDVVPRQGLDRALVPRRDRPFLAPLHRFRAPLLLGPATIAVLRACGLAAGLVGGRSRVGLAPGPLYLAALRGRLALASLLDWLIGHLGRRIGIGSGRRTA